jgi:hypothetical protein
MCHTLCWRAFPRSGTHENTKWGRNVRSNIRLAALLLLGGCSTQPTDTDAASSISGWEVNTETSKVDGIRTCSAHRGDLFVFYARSPNGRLAKIETFRDQYPGDPFTANIDGVLYEGNDSIVLTDIVTTGLSKGGDAYFSYVSWPERAAKEFTVNVDNFDQVHAKCTAYIDGSSLT